MAIHDGRGTPVALDTQGRILAAEGPGDEARLIRLADGSVVRADVIDHVFQFGEAGDVPLAGDFTGDGVPNIAVYNNGVWKIDTNGDGRFGDGDLTIQTPYRGTPIVGDWNGDGIDNIGIYNNGRWILDTNGDFQLDDLDRAFEMGQPGDIPIAGDWNGDGRDEPGLYRPNARGGEPSTAHTGDTRQR